MCKHIRPPEKLYQNPELGGKMESKWPFRNPQWSRAGLSLWDVGFIQRDLTFALSSRAADWGSSYIRWTGYISDDFTW